MMLQPGSRPVPDYPDYQLVRKLGAGAFGEVWHAHGPGGLDVALKFIRLDTHVRALELRSLEVMKSIRHPNLVSLFGAWHKNDWLILAMELCDRSLQDRLTEALDQKLPGIPLQELLSYMNDAANGLDALNAKQVQHRDVKPANLLLLDSGVKVADFGLAKALEQTVASNSGAGTLVYTAPECFKGQLTQQSDQYSLAVTYYHLRTGHLLFKGDQAQVMYAHLEMEPDLSRLPAAEGVVLAQALSKEPGKRWRNCKVFVNELIKAHQKAKEEERQRQEAERRRQEQERQKRESEAAERKRQEEDLRGRQSTTSGVVNEEASRARAEEKQNSASAAPMPREPCWFCKVTANENPLSVSLYKINQRTNTYVVDGISCETRYVTTKVEVPKCRDCEKKHFRLVLPFLLLFLAVLTPVLVLLGSIFWDGWKRGESTFGLVCAFLFGFALMSLIVAVPIGILGQFIEIVLDACGINTERRSRQYPPIKALLSEGWEVGTKPP